SVPGQQADSVHPAAPCERRVSPSESNFQDAMDRVDRYSVPQTVISDSSGGASRVHDGAPAAAPTEDLVLALVDDDSVPQQPDLRLDGHAPSSGRDGLNTSRDLPFAS